MFKMFSVLAILAACWFGGTDTAHAYSWWTVPNTSPTAADLAQLPQHITVDIVDPAGAWLPVTGNTWTHIWPRNATGAWYRMAGYSQPNLRMLNVYPYAYRCYVHTGFSFRCRDIARQIDRYISCPANARINWMIKWRSQYNSAWPELGLFWAAGGPFNVNWGKLVPVASHSTTQDGQQINCAYGPTTPQGPGTVWDIWLWR
jgi:hypothetical protein